jgi:sec-independent protein translocase protein TatC
VRAADLCLQALATPPSQFEQKIEPQVSDTQTVDAAAPPETRPHDREMPFREHLREMRNRIMWSLGSWIVCAIGTWFLVPYILEAMRRPLGNTPLIFTKPTEAFMVYLKTAILGGLFMALPLILYQLAAFVSPGLEANEKRWIKRVVPAAFILFIGGTVFGYFCVLPVTMGFFLGFQVPGVQAMITISEYIGFISMMLIVCGLVFQTPIVIVVLAAIGLVDAPMLRRSRRWAILLIFIIAAIVTPTPDAFTQSVVAAPMLILYELSIWIVVLMKRKPKNVEAT